MIRFWWLLLFFPLYIYMWTDAAQVGFGHDLKCIESAAACLSRYYKSFSRMLCWVVLYCILILVRTKLILVGWIPCPFRVGYFCIVDWCRNESCLSSTATWNWAHTHTHCVPFHTIPQSVHTHFAWFQLHMNWFVLWPLCLATNCFFGSSHSNRWSVRDG